MPENSRHKRSGRSPESADAVWLLSDSELIEYAFLTSGSEPRTYKEAMNRDAGLWHEASEQEYKALLEHGVWELWSETSRI